jgi:hypothetical protein
LKITLSDSAAAASSTAGADAGEDGTKKDAGSDAKDGKDEDASQLTEEDIQRKRRTAKRDELI